MWRVAHRGKPVVLVTIGRLTQTGFPRLSERAALRRDAPPQSHVNQ
jgi:hypothetical protein